MQEWLGFANNKELKVLKILDLHASIRDVVGNKTGSKVQSFRIILSDIKN